MVSESDITIHHGLQREISDEKELLDIIEKRGAKDLLSFLKIHHDIPSSTLSRAVYDVIQTEDTMMLTILLAADLDLTQGNHQHLLAKAVEVANAEIIRYLLDRGIHLGEQNQSLPGLLPLEIAVDKADPNLVQMLLDSGIKMTATNFRQETAIHRAATLNSSKMLKIFLDQDCPVDVTARNQGHTPMMCAVQKGCLENVKLLLEYGGNLNMRELDTGITILDMAIMQGGMDIVNILLSHMNTDQINQVTVEGQTPLHIAALHDRPHLIPVLVDAGVKEGIRDEQMNSAVMAAVHSGHKECAIQFLKHYKEGNSLMLQDARGETLLHKLLQVPNSWSIDVMTLLLEKVSENILEIKNETNDTALMVATKNGLSKMVKLLLDHGANLKTQNSKMETPMHVAIIQNNNDIIDMFILHEHLDVDGVDGEGDTMLHKAASVGNSTLFERLIARLERNEVMNHQNMQGDTPLHILLQKSPNVVSSNLILQIMERRPNLSLVNNEGDTSLMLACTSAGGNVHSILQLIGSEQMNTIINISNKDGNTALHYACDQKDIDTAIELLEHNASCNIQNKCANSPLHVAVANSMEEIVQKMILEKNADINLVGNKAQTPLHHAARQGLERTVQTLLEKGAQVDIPSAEPSPLIHAARRGHVLITEQLLRHGASVNTIDNYGRTALVWAAQGGHMSCIRELLENLADSMVVDDSGDTALTVAAWTGQADVLKLLIPLSDLNHCEREEGMSALHLAIAKDHTSCVQVLLEAGAAINIVDRHHNTALLAAAMLTSGTEIIQLVLNCGQSYDIDTVGNKGRSPLHWAIGDPDSVRLILTYNPNLDLLDENQASPLLLAIAHDQPMSARYLIEAGCSVKLIHEDGRSAIHYAAIYGDVSTTRLLLERGMDADLPMQDGRCPLLLAAIENQVEVMKVLLQHKVEIDRVYFDAFTALSTAVSNEFDEAVVTLLRHGADPDVIGSKKYRALIHAIFKNYLFGVVHLIEAGADLEMGLIDGKHPIQVAALHNNLTIIYTLLEAGCNPNSLKHILNEGTIYYFIENKNVLGDITDLSRCPRSLKNQSRDVARKHTRYPLESNIEKLLLPVRIKEQLMLSNVSVTQS